ncbi:MAG: hypothetical protein Kow00121_09810 [Elainellaceae cyanobacterium]
MQRHQDHLSQQLGLPQAALPSYSTIRRLLMELDFNAVPNTFNRWAQACGLVQTG